jgi:hypothetical protein
MPVTHLPWKDREITDAQHRRLAPFPQVPVSRHLERYRGGYRPSFTRLPSAARGAEGEGPSAGARGMGVPAPGATEAMDLPPVESVAATSYEGDGREHAVLSVTDGEILAAVEDIGRVCASRRCRRCPSRASRPSPGLLRPGGRSDHLRALGRRYPVPPHSWRPASWHLDRSIRRPSGGPVPVERKTEGYWDQRSAATWKTSSSRPAVAAMRAPTGFRGAASDPHLTPNQGKEDR